MKKLLTIVLLAGALGSGPSLQAQNPTPSTAAAVTRQKTYAPVKANENTEGSLQRGVRLGNVAQMVNPFAPARYGTGEDLMDQRAPHQQNPQEGLRQRGTANPEPAQGLRLFSITF